MRLTLCHSERSEEPGRTGGAPPDRPGSSLTLGMTQIPLPPGEGGAKRRVRGVFLATLLANASPVFAHAGHHHLDPAEVMTWWTWEPVVSALLGASALLYVIGLVRLWRKAGRSKGIRAWQVIAFAGGWAALAIALVSPLDALGSILFSAHMAQHEVLMVIAAPLLVLGRPLIALLWAMPSRWRAPLARGVQSPPVATVWNFLTAPAVAVVVHALALWMWHLPSLYQATLRSEPVHALQHTSFIVTAALFWWALIHGRYGRLGYGASVIYVFITSIHSGALGALLTFSPHLWYPIYQTRTAAWGLDAIEDQQLAGLIMWVPAGVILLILGLALFTAWLGEAERRVRLAEMENR
jgi:putative membrane protein